MTLKTGLVARASPSKINRKTNITIDLRKKTAVEMLRMRAQGTHALVPPVYRCANISFLTFGI